MRDRTGFDLRLAVLAAGAGVVDVISLTVLGAFTAAVTADLVFVGIAIQDGDDHTAARAALAVVAFGAGAYGAMRVVAGAPAESRRSRGTAVLAGIAVLQTAFLLRPLAGDLGPSGGRRARRPRAASGMRDGRPDGGHVPVAHRRRHHLFAVICGALLGAVLLAHARESVPLLPIALTLLVAIASLARARRRRAT